MGWNQVGKRPIIERPVSIDGQTDCNSEGSFSTTNRQEKVLELKDRLKCLLAKHCGSTKHPDVIDTINELAELNPYKEKCAQSSQFPGDFVSHTSPNFPGRLKPAKGQENVVQYTLGRLSFGIFEPHHLVCTVRSIHNLVKKETMKDAKHLFSYNFICDITIHTPDGDLPANLIMEGQCYESSNVNNRLNVTFTGGTLKPIEDVWLSTNMMDLWTKTFADVYKKANEERSFSGWAWHFILKAMLGLSMPSDDTKRKEGFHFEMKRSPIGHLDVLYLDEFLRITRGNRGTVVVVERAMETAIQ